MFVDAAAHGGVALGVQVHQKHTLAQACQGRTQVHASRGFADTTFLVCYRDYVDH